MMLFPECNLHSYKECSSNLPVSTVTLTVTLTLKQRSRDYPNYANFRYQEALDWRKWTRRMQLPFFVLTVLIKLSCIWNIVS